MVAALRASLPTPRAVGVVSCPKATGTAAIINRPNQSKANRTFMFSSYRSFPRINMALCFG